MNTVAKRRGLGRGLDALIPSGPAEDRGQVRQIDIEVIQPNPRQPRRDFDAADLAELADSIAEHGVLQPLLLAQPEDSQEYVLIAGERRLQAAKKAGLATVPAVVRVANEQQLLVWALIENLQREDLNPIEAAEGYRQLAEDFELSHEAIAERVGKSRSTISNSLRLLQLPEGLQQAVQSRQISEGHARALLALDTAKAQQAALRTILEGALNVRQTEDLVRRLSGKSRTPRKKTSKRSPEEKALEDELQQSLGTKVSLRSKKEGGSITLYYYSNEELNALVERLTDSSK